MAMRGTSIVTACAVIALRFAFCCYRAATQSVTHDEAYTFLRFADGPFWRVYSTFDANNHVLNTMLMWVPVHVFGLSAFAMRLPSLAGGLALTVGCFFLLKDVRSAAFRWVAFLAICLNPMLLDFSVAARGYSLALAFFVWALWFLMRGSPAMAGALLGCAASANLAMAFPVLAVVGAAALAAPGSVRERWRTVREALVYAIAVFAVVCFGALRTAHLSQFYDGMPTLKAAVLELMFTSIHARPDHTGLFGSIETARVIAYYLLPLAAAIMLWLTPRIWREDWRKAIPPASLAVTIAGLIVAHKVFGLVYPTARTCLYAVVLTAWAWAVAGDAIRNRVTRGVWLAAGVILAVQFAMQIQGRYFQIWWLQADEKQMAQAIADWGRGRADGSVAVETFWIHQPSLEFYRKSMGIRALKPVERRDEVTLEGHDVYIVSEGALDRARTAPGFRAIYADMKIGVMVLVEWPVAGGIDRAVK